MKSKSIIVVALVALVISACNFPFVAESETALATTVAETVEAMEVKVVAPTLAAPTVAPATPAPTATTSPTETPEEVDPCLFATFVSETVSDNTVYSAGANFTKTWTFRNTGTCDWNTDYQVVFVKGDQMGGPDEQNIPAETDPGEDVTIEVNLTAPSSAGTYTGYWQFETHKELRFGENYFFVKIVVE